MNLLALRLPTYTEAGMPVFRFRAMNIGDVFSALLPYVFVAAGLLLLGLLIWGGFQYLSSGGDPKAIEAAKGRLTGAIAGFIIIFTSYWVVQAVEIIFKIDIL